MLNLTFIRIIRCCLEVAKSIVDLAKALACSIYLVDARRKRCSSVWCSYLRCLGWFGGMPLIDSKANLRSSGLQVMDAFIAFEAHRKTKRALSRAEGFLIDEEEVLCCLPYYHVQQLHCGAVVPMNTTPYVEFQPPGPGGAFNYMLLV